MLILSWHLFYADGLIFISCSNIFGHVSCRAHLETFFYSWLHLSLFFVYIVNGTGREENEREKKKGADMGGNWGTSGVGYLLLSMFSIVIELYLLLKG